MNYIDILRSNYFKQTYLEIEELKKDYPVNHGFIHINNVIENSKKLAAIFNLNDKEKELLLIAACLHDIGYLKGRENHAYNGSVLAKDVLKEWDFGENDINIICETIKNHGGREQFEYKDKISMCLIAADKIDFISSRYDIARLDPDKAKIFANIKDTFIEYKKSKVILNIVTKNNFDITTFESMSFYTRLNIFLNLLSKQLNSTYYISYINI